MSILFTGCQHYQHFNIIKYCDRPYKTTEQMDTDMIRRHNEIVKPSDEVYNTGDYLFHSANNGGNGKKLTALDYAKQLNGNHIFIAGNHDKDNRNTLKTKNHEIILAIKKLKIQVIHDPKYAKVDYPLIVHSHVHNMWRVKELKYYGKLSLMFNCGVDVNNFTPVKLDTILGIYYRWDSIKKNYKEVQEFLKRENKGTKIG